METSEAVTLVLGCVFVVSEYLGTTKRFKGNSVLQAIMNILKALKG